jgi:hypothetical protein
MWWFKGGAAAEAASDESVIADISGGHGDIPV